MSLTEEQIEHFYREGYVVAPKAVRPGIVREVMKHAAGKAKPGDFWQPTIFRHDQPLIDAEIHRLLVEPGVVQAATQLLNSPARVYYGMLAVVPAGGRGLPWHQDNQYSTILGGALNVFIALSRITPEMAMLWVSPRSHLMGTQPSRSSAEHEGHRIAVVEPTNGVCLPTLEPGDACIFDRNTYHRSVKNETGQPRFAYAAQYQADGARMANDGKKDPTRMRATELRKTLAAAPATA